MPRRGFVPKREVLPDPVHGTTVVTKLINQIMLDGKRGVAQNVCYEAFDTIKEKTGKDANEVFQAALANVAPSLEVKARRVGGATYQVPIEIRPERRQTLALRWLVMFSRKRGEKTMAERLAAEIMRLQERVDDARLHVPPHREPDEDRVVGAHIASRAGDGGTARLVVHLHRTAAFAIVPVQIGGGVGLRGLDLVHVGTQRVRDPAGRARGRAGGGEIGDQYPAHDLLPSIHNKLLLILLL